MLKANSFVFGNIKAGSMKRFLYISYLGTDSVTAQQSFLKKSPFHKLSVESETRQLFGPEQLAGPTYRDVRIEHAGLHPGWFAPHVRNVRSTGRVVARGRGDRSEPVRPISSEVVAGEENRQVRVRRRERVGRRGARRPRDGGQGDGSTHKCATRGARERQDASEGP